ncbi:hypothetical protein OROMI_026551 [Orobanche minor]
MGIKHIAHEFKANVSRSRLFKALITHPHEVLPKCTGSIKSIEIVHGSDVSDGCIIKATLPDGIKYVKHRIDSIKHDKYECEYTLIEGDVRDKLEKVRHNMKFQTTEDGGRPEPNRTEPSRDESSRAGRTDGGGGARACVCIKYVKHRIDSIKNDKYECEYTLIEGDVLGDKLEKVRHNMKFQTTEDGGCVIKVESEYHTKGDIELKDDDIKAGEEQALALYNACEAYLIANPNVFA